jgi:hypothetical protein
MRQPKRNYIDVSCLSQDRERGDNFTLRGCGSLAWSCNCHVRMQVNDAEMSKTHDCFYTEGKPITTRNATGSVDSANCQKLRNLDSSDGCPDGSSTPQYTVRVVFALGRITSSIHACRSHNDWYVALEVDDQVVPAIKVSDEMPAAERLVFIPALRTIRPQVEADALTSQYAVVRGAAACVVPPLCSGAPRALALVGDELCCTAHT